MVYLAPTDLPSLNAISEVAADMFRKIGMNLDYVATDWGTVAQRFASREPLEKGGWSLMAPLIPDRRYSTEKNQIALAWYAERIGRSGVRFE